MDMYLRITLLTVLASVIILFLSQWRAKRVARCSVLQDEPILSEKIEEIELLSELESELENSISEDIILETDASESYAISSPKIPSQKNNLISISVFAQPHQAFASYDLLQAISATNMQFGEMNIFHYYQRTAEGKKVILFSLASATKPGEFDLDKIGSFSCIGLTLFMDINRVSNPLQAFYLMINTAEQLADDLEGELKVSPNVYWSDDHFRQYQQQILELEPRGCEV